MNTEDASMRRVRIVCWFLLVCVGLLLGGLEGLFSLGVR